MVDVEFAKRCAGSIRAKYGAQAEEFVRQRIEKVDALEVAPARLCGARSSALWNLRLAARRLVTNVHRPRPCSASPGNAMR